MIFRLLFIAAAGDCFVNGPAKEQDKLAAAAVSLVATAVNAQWLFFLAQTVWIAVFVKAWVESGSSSSPSSSSSSSTTGTTSPTPSGTNAVVARSANQVPEQIKSELNQSMEMFLKNEKGDVACDGERWTVLSDKNGIRISSSTFKGQPFLRWRTEVRGIYGPRDGIFQQLFDYATRVGPNGWDTAIAWGKVVKDYDDGYRLVNYATAPAAGGLVSGREFVDARLVRNPDEAGGVLLVGLGLDDKKHKAVIGADVFPPGDKSLTRALAFPGGGFRLSPADGNPPPDGTTPITWNFVMVTAVLLNGWIPQSTLNAATSSVLAESTAKTVEHLNNVFPRP